MLSKRLINNPIITKRLHLGSGNNVAHYRRHGNSTIHHLRQTTTIHHIGYTSLTNGTKSKMEDKVNVISSSYLGTFVLLTSIFGLSCAALTVTNQKPTFLEAVAYPTEKEEEEDETTTVINWSGTHTIEVPNKHYFEPESITELQSIVSHCHEQNIPIRPVGSALSPNAISFQPMGMVSMANLDQIIKIDEDKMTITVQAGARVSQVIDALRPYGLTLPNLASIAEQQMGGFVQIGAHGTGANIPPVDDFVRSFTMITPAQGKITFNKPTNNNNDADDGNDHEMFHLAKVGLGCLGIVSEITMDCIPSHRLLEHTYVLTRKEAKENINDLLKKHKHIRYMWIPYEDAVVVVTNDPEDKNSEQILEEYYKAKKSSNKRGGGNNDDDTMKPLKDLLKELNAKSTTNQPTLTDEMINEKGFGELRDALLAFDPLNGNHVKAVNKAEAKFWKQNEGYQLKPSDQLLQFDCGGQQWVFEVCFPTGTYEKDNGNDMKLMEELLDKIESESIPAPAPIEQRWSASSSSTMSPAHGPEGGLHCWVGIIMYLPSDDPNERKEITNQFKKQYCDVMREIGKPYNIVSHWGKLEMPTNGSNFLDLRSLMEARYPLAKFNAARLFYDPKNLLGNDLLNTVLGTPK